MTGVQTCALPISYTTGNRPVEGVAGIWRKDFGDGSYIRYDREEKRLDIVSDSVHVESLNIAGDLTVDGAIEAKSIKTTGNVHVGGNLTVDGSYPG